MTAYCDMHYIFVSDKSHKMKPIKYLRRFTSSCSPRKKFLLVMGICLNLIIALSSLSQGKPYSSPNDLSGKTSEQKTYSEYIVQNNIEAQAKPDTTKKYLFIIGNTAKDKTNTSLESNTIIVKKESVSNCQNSDNEIVFSAELMKECKQKSIKQIII